jgi:hypothetical protein
VLEQLYTLKVTDNKRRLIYDENNKLIGSTPYVINEKKNKLSIKIIPFKFIELLYKHKREYLLFSFVN